MRPLVLLIACAACGGGAAASDAGAFEDGGSDAPRMMDVQAGDVGSDAPKGDVPFPALDQDFPDPYVLRDGATYHAFATNVGLFAPQFHVPHTQSSDLVHWAALDDALPVLGSWAEDGLFTWAPGVLKVADGAYVLFYADKKVGTAPSGQSGEQCIGRASATKPEGPFTDGFGTPLVCDPQGYWAIDPSPLHANGKTYLLWRQDTAGAPTAINHVYIRELDATGTSFAPQSHASDLLARDAVWEDPVLENPSMVEVGGKVLLFYSANDWQSGGYGVGYAECASATGPCTKVTTQGPWFGSIYAIAGPGGQDFFTDTHGEAWMSYHTWVAPKVGYGNGGARVLALTRIGLDSAGKPSLERATLP